MDDEVYQLTSYWAAYGTKILVPQHASTQRIAQLEAPTTKLSGIEIKMLFDQDWLCSITLHLIRCARWTERSIVGHQFQIHEELPYLNFHQN